MPARLPNPYVGPPALRRSWRRPPPRSYSRTDCWLNEVTADSPVAWWRTEETAGTNADDQIGTADGTYTGGFTLNQTGATVGGVAVLLNGTTGYISVPASAPLNNLVDTFTLECWVKRTTTGAALMKMLSKGTDSFMMSFNNDFVEIANQGNAVIASSTTQITDTTTWHHIVWTKGAAANFIFIDKVDVTGAVTNSTMLGNSSALNIGRKTDNTEFLNGQIDEIALYNYVLTPSRIAVHYDAASIACASTAQNLTRDASDSLTIADSATRVFTGFRTTSDSLTVADSATRIGTFLRSVTAALTISDVATRVVTLARTAADSLTIADVATRVGTFVRTTTDALTISDTATRVGTFIRTTSDSLNIADAATRIKTSVRTAADSLTIADSATRVVTLLRSVSDSLTIADAATRVATLLRSVADSLNIADSAVAVRTFVRTVADSLNIADAATRTGTFIRSVTATLTIADSATRVVTLLRSATDSLSISDAATRIGTFVRSVTASLNIADAATRTKASVRTAADALGISDIATRIVTTGSVGIGSVGVVLGGTVARVWAAGSAIRSRLAGDVTAPKPGGEVVAPKPGGTVED